MTFPDAKPLTEVQLEGLNNRLDIDIEIMVAGSGQNAPSPEGIANLKTVIIEIMTPILGRLDDDMAAPLGVAGVLMVATASAASMLQNISDQILSQVEPMLTVPPERELN